MDIKLIRLQDDGSSTIGTMIIDGKFECFTLEDTYRDTKVYGKTSISRGVYEIKLRTEGGMTGRYKKIYGDMHKGMLWLQDVPDFKYVYIHTGNYANKETFLHKIEIFANKEILDEDEFIEVVDG